MTQTTLWDETHHAGTTLFHEPISRMVRRDDPPTSHEAARKVEPRLSALQKLIIDIFKIRGKMTAKECERRPSLVLLAPSTVRKRICELFAMGLIRKTGVVRDGCAEYEVANKQNEAQT